MYSYCGLYTFHTEFCMLLQIRSSEKIVTDARLTDDNIASVEVSVTTQCRFSLVLHMITDN